MKLLLYRIYQFTLMWPLMLAATIVTALLTIVGSMCGLGRWAGYWPQHVWARVMCLLTLVRVTVSGRENIAPRTSYVFVANHQGAYDIFSIAGWLDHNFRWMMKASLRRIPLVGYACEKGHQIYVDKSTPGRLRNTMKRAEQLLSHGMSLVVFPEGARTLDGRMHRFKKGAYVLASEFSLPVVPITIDGSYAVLPRTGKLPRWGHIHLTIHKPIHPDPQQGHDMASLIETSAEAVESALPASQRRASTFGGRDC